MKVENKTYWEDEIVIGTQDQTVTSATKFEKFMFQEAKNRLQNANLTINNINIFGCGTGRDINEVSKFFGDINIVASDISENMIKKCNQNLLLWDLKNIKTTVSNATNIDFEKGKFEIVTILNSMLTYVHNREERNQIFQNSYEMLKNKGVIIGAVHHQIGVPTKTLYFKLKSIFSIFLKGDVGHRYSGSKGFEVKTYYYTRDGLRKDLINANFKNIEIYSLEEYFASIGEKYDRYKGYNNLIFIASK